MNRFCIYHDSLRLARQHGDEAAIRSLQREIRRLRNNELISEMTARGPAEVIHRIRLVAQEPTYSGVFARRVLRRLQSAAFETVIR
jgi:hypothetical protein